MRAKRQYRTDGGFVHAHKGNIGSTEVIREWRRGNRGQLGLVPRAIDRETFLRTLPADGRSTETEKLARAPAPEPRLVLRGEIRHRLDQFAGVCFA